MSENSWRTAFMVLLVLLALLLISIGLSGCSTTATAYELASSDPWGKTFYWTDDDTGVEYIVVERWDTRGGVSITPRLNADGSVMVADEG